MHIKISKKLLVFSYNVVGDKMKEKLPKVFANSSIKKTNTNDKVYHLKGTETEVKQNRSSIKQKLDIPQENINNKINALFRSTKYVYKIDVEITTKNATLKKRVIGKNKTNLITIDNELIAIDDILDIKIL
jgi:hypothetical protein